MISLIESMLPRAEIVERNVFEKKTTIPQGNTQQVEQIRQSIFTQNYKIIELFLKVAEDAAIAVIDKKYTAFDALVKNFGCQMTALEVQQLLSEESLLNEALSLIKTILKIQGVVKERKFIKKSRFNFSEFCSTIPEMGDLKVSERMARLTRLRFLAIVNNNKIVNEREVPYTELGPMIKLVKNLDIKFLDTLVVGLQADESFRAVSFIQEQAKQISPANPRKRIISEALLTVKEKTAKGERTGTSFTSLLYNMEACLCRIDNGIVLVKNKLKLGNMSRLGESPIHVYTDSC